MSTLLTTFQTNKKLLIQCAHSMQTCIDMQRLTYQRHAAWTVAHQYDYWHFIGWPCPERAGGAWDKIYWIRQALKMHYEFIAWLDTDAAIVKDEDLTGCFDKGGLIGACLHDANGIPAHLNVGVIYVKNDPLTMQFFEDWWASYPGEERWMEQGSFNTLAKSDAYAGVVVRVDDKYNATVSVNDVADPIVKGWHGVYPFAQRLNAMKQFFWQDYMKFRV
jgi:hypothetical protein